MQRPMSMNGYSWVEGNTPNLTDASGKQTDLQIPGIMDQGGGGGGILLLLLLIAAAGGSSPGPGGSGNPLLQELAEEINDGICDIRDAAISLFSDTSSSDADTNTDTAENVQPDENTNDNDCFNGQTAQQAALTFAWFAQMYWVVGKMAAGNNNPPITTAFTIVREGNECKGYIAVSNSFRVRIPDQIDWYNDAWAGINDFAQSVSPFARAAPSDEVVGESVPNTYQGVNGHAERLLYNRLGTRIKAMGISKKPCDRGDDSCEAWFGKPPANQIEAIAYWEIGQGAVPF